MNRLIVVFPEICRISWMRHEGWLFCKWFFAAIIIPFVSSFSNVLWFERRRIDSEHCKPATTVLDSRDASFGSRPIHRSSFWLKPLFVYLPIRRTVVYNGGAQNVAADNLLLAINRRRLSVRLIVSGSDPDGCEDRYRPCKVGSSSAPVCRRWSVKTDEQPVRIEACSELVGTL